MRSGAVIAVALLSACAAAPIAPPPPDELLRDALFGPASERISAKDVFALSGAMKRYLRQDLAGPSATSGPRQALIDAVSHGQLKLEYDSVRTRTAAETFEARAGNCLSLVIMTAALAKEIGLPVRFQRVYVDDTWTRSGDVTFSVGHVNIGLGRRQIDGAFGRNDSDMMTID